MLAALINFFVHPKLGGDADRLLRVRILIAVLMTLVVQESLVLIVLLSQFPPAAVLFGGSLTLASILTSAGLLILLRRFGSYSFCGVAAMLITLLLISTGICISGGFWESPATQLIVAPLLMAYFFGGIRWGSYTTALSFTIGLAIIVLQSIGLEFMQVIHSATEVKNARLLISSINFTFISGMAFAYEYAAVGLRRERDCERENYIRLAKTDPLTGLANRRNFDALLLDRIQSYAASSPTQPFVLGYIDLDGFKPINDDYGHGVGDQVLRIVSDRLRATLRDSEFVGRYGGDEFMLILDSPSGAANLEIVAQRLLSTIAQPINTSKGLVSVRGSLGFALFPAHGATIDTLKQTADAAMYEAKRTHSGWHTALPM